MAACRPKPFNIVTHTIFDMDGLLLNTETLYTKATQNVLDIWGKTFTWEAKTQIMGLQRHEMNKKMVQLYDLPVTPEQYYQIALKQYEVIMPTSELMPGAFDLVRHLKLHKIPMAVATSSARNSFDLKTQRHKDFFALFDLLVLGGDDPEIKHGKPDPTIFLVCASRFHDKPCVEQCLFFEDAPNGVQGSLNAGMPVVMVPDENLPKQLTKGATVVIKSLEDTPLELFGLPKLKKCELNRITD